jgi:DNA-binding Xre family transcriptional regulator
MSASSSSDEETGLPQPLDMLYQLMAGVYGMEIGEEEVTVLYGLNWTTTGLEFTLPDGRGAHDHDGRRTPVNITTPHLKKIRVQQFIPVAELAKRSGVTSMTVWRLEHGKPASMSTVKKLATALNVDPHDLAVIHDEEESGQ